MVNVSGQVLAMIRQQVNAMLTDTCIIQRQAAQTDVNGYMRGGWLNVTADVPCRLLPQNNRSAVAPVIAAQEVNRSYYRLILKTDADLRNGDRVTLGDQQYEVMQISTSTTDKAFNEAQVATYGD